jgi:hypothetical protein
VKKNSLLRKTFAIHSPNSVAVNRQKLVSEIKAPVPLIWGKSADLFLESFRKRMHQYYVGYNILYGKVSEHNFQIHHFIEGKSSLTAYGRLEKISTGTVIYVTVDRTINFISSLLILLIVIYISCHGTLSLSLTSGLSTAKTVFSSILVLGFFSQQRKLFQDEFIFYRSRLSEIFE